MPAYWTVNGTETDGLEGPQSTLTPGDTPDFTFLIRDRPDWEDPTDDHLSRYRQIRSFASVAGQFDSYESVEGDWYWREQTTETPLVRIVPPDDDPIAQAIWGLIDDIEDETTLSEKRCVLTLSVRIISLGDTFSSETALRTAREVTGP